MRAARTAFLTAALAFLTTSSAAGQSGAADFRDEILRHFESSARKVVALANVMPEATYGWAPDEGVATVGQVFMHIATYNHMYPDQNLGVDGPVGEGVYGGWEDAMPRGEEQYDKGQVIEILEASMEHVRHVMGTMDAAQLDGETTLYGRTVPGWAVLLQLVSHMNEHLGQSIAYARANRVVPPWSN